MKKYLRCSITLLLMTMLLIQAFPLSCNAVEVNSHTVAVGDIITYELHSGSCPKDIYALDVSIYYDNVALEIVEDSFELPNLSGYVANTDLEGEIRFNAINLEGFQFQADKILATVKFKVVSDYNPYPKLKFEIKNFIDIEFVDHLETYTYDLTYVNEDFSSVQEKNSDSDVVSVTSENSSDSDAGEKINSDSESLENSKADVNTDSVVSSLESESVNTDSDDESDSLSGNSQGSASEANDLETADIVETSDSVNNQESKINMNVVFAVAAVIVALLAAVFVIIKKSSHTGSHMSK